MLARLDATVKQGLRSAFKARRPGL